MYTWVSDYIEIENNPKYHRRKGQLVEQLLTSVPPSEQISFDDLLMILNQLEQHHAKLRMPLFARVVYPVLAREIETGNLQAIKVMLHHTWLLDNYYSMMKLSDGYSKIGLINRYLLHDPVDREVLQRKETFLDHFLSYSTHELP